MSKTIRITLSKNEFVLGNDGKLYYKELKREVLHDTVKRPTYWPRFLELRSEGATYWECATRLMTEGHVAKNGKPVTENTLRVQSNYYNEGRTK